MAQTRYAKDELDALLNRIQKAHQNSHPIPCIDTPSLIWISENKADQQRAGAACNTCPLATRCKDYAETFQEPSGIWGGSLPIDRKTNGLPRQMKVAQQAPGENK